MLSAWRFSLLVTGVLAAMVSSVLALLLPDAMALLVLDSRELLGLHGLVGDAARFVGAVAASPGRGKGLENRRYDGRYIV